MKTQSKVKPVTGSWSDKSNKKPSENLSFMMIKEQEFPHLFEDPVLKLKKKQKLVDEQDYESDCEIIERNKAELLQCLEKGIARFNSGKCNPKKFIKNLEFDDCGVRDTLAEAATADRTDVASESAESKECPSKLSVPDQN